MHYKNTTLKPYNTTNILVYTLYLTASKYAIKATCALIGYLIINQHPWLVTKISYLPLYACNYSHWSHTSKQNTGVYAPLHGYMVDKTQYICEVTQEEQSKLCALQI